MAEDKSRAGLILIGTPLALVASIFVFLVLITSGSAAACSVAGGSADPEKVPADPVAGYAGPQLQNAAHIMNAARTLGLSRAAQVVGVMTAMGESSLTVIDHGDAAGPDSRGLFQQRANGAWGSEADRMDPTISATNFFTALVAVPGWEGLSPTIAAHKVQHNADPYHYETYGAAAEQLVTALSTGASGSGCAAGALVLPLAPGYTLTSGYGPRVAPIEGASSWHPADDFQHPEHPCGDQIFAITGGTVTYVGGYQVTIKAPAGYDVTYMHMKLSEVSVTVGQQVVARQPIALVGGEGPSTGCHLDLRINTTGSIDPAISALPDGIAQGGPAVSAGFVDPEAFYRLFGMELCAPNLCRKNVS